MFVKTSAFSLSCQTKLVCILSRFGTREMSSPGNLREQIVDAAYREFMMKPMAVMNSINSGIPRFISGFGMS